MDPKNQNTTVVPPDDGNEPQLPPALAVAPEPMSPEALSSGVPGYDAQVVTASPRSGNIRRALKVFFKWGALVTAVFVLIGGAVLLVWSGKRDASYVASVNPAASFDSQAVPLEDFADFAPAPPLDQARMVVINGTLTANNGLVIAPSLQPANPQPGQLYFDETTNTLGYFNGTEFVMLDRNEPLQPVGLGVQDIAGLVGQIPLGAGLGAVAGQLVNTGVLSVQGQTGAVTFSGGSGISINGTTITNTGVISVVSSSPALTVSNDGNGNLTLNLVGAGTGTVSSPGGTAGRIAKFTGVQTIADSLLSESGTTVTLAGDLTVTGTAALGAPLTVANGGTGAASLASNGVLIGNGTSPITSVVAGAPGLCFVSTAGAPAWANCTSPVNAVQSLNGLTGNLTIANATGLVDTITIDDASTSNKGIAQFNSTNFSVSGGNVNTIQNISTSSSPTFNSLTLSGNLTVQGGTSTFGTLTQAGSLMISDGSSNTVTIIADNLSGDRIYRLPDAGGDATLCVTSGNCIGGSGSAPNTAPYLVATLDGTLTDERTLAAGANIDLADGGANSTLTVATVQNPTFSTSVTTPMLQSSGALVISSTAGNTVAIDAGTTIELQDSTNVTGTLSVSVALNVGTGNAFSVDTNGIITAAAGITSSGTIVFSALDCTTFANGGVLTTDSSGQLMCSDDDGGAGSGITGTGTNGTIPVFTGSNAIANSIITQSGTTITVAGDLVLNTDLTVSNGGTGASSFTSNGVLYGNGTGALQVTTAGTGGQVLVANASGVPTFVTFSGDVTVSDTGTTTIQPNSVALGTDTTGDYIANLGTLTGLNATGNSGEGSTPSLSVLYGSVAGTAVQGNVTLTCPAGTGNLTGGGDSITLGTGGACGNLSTVDDPTFGTSVTTPNLILTGSGSDGSIVVGNLGQGTIYTLPDPGQAAADICLSVGNCATAGTAGGDLTGTYPNPTIASLQGTNLSINSPVGGHVLVYNGTNNAWENVAISGDIAIGETGVTTIQANSVALGTDTTGNYVIGLTAGNGIDVSGTAGEGWTPTVAVLYGSSANTAVQGNTQITVTAGTNLTGGGTITLGAGGTVTLNVANSPTFSGMLTVQGGTATVGTTSQQGVIVLHDGAGETGTIQTDTLGQSVTYTLPDPGQATAEICLTTGNCAGVGGGVTTAGGTTNRLAKFTGAQALGDSLVSDDGSTVTITGSGNFVVQGGTATLGTLSQAGTLVVSDGSSNTISVVASGLSGDYQFTLPDTGGNATFCMSTGNCIGSGGGGAPSDASYLVLGLHGDLNNERVLTNGSNITITDGGANGNLTVATVQNPTFTTSVTTPALQSSGALTITSGASDSVVVDAGTTIELQSNTNVTGVLDVSVSLSVGTGDAFSVNSSGAITAAAGITSSGTIVFSALDCTTFANGGKLTTNGSGQLECADDDDAAADAITGTGTNGTISMFTGANTIADSIITQSGGNTITITGSLTLSNALTVANGGTGASSFTANGVLYGNGTGALQVTSGGTGGQVLIANASGVPTFVTFSGDVTVSNTGVTTIQPDSVALGTDTTGNYVLSVTAGNGISVSGSAGEGWTPTISVQYGSAANTAVQGNVTLTCPAGTGNLTGGGNSITLGAGGSCDAISTVSDPTFSTSVTTPDLILTGAGSDGSLQVAVLGQATTFTLPDPGASSADICLSTGNCVAAGTAGGDLTGSYPNPIIASIQGSAIDINTPAGGHMLVYNASNSQWENVAISGDITISETGVVTIANGAVTSLKIFDGTIANADLATGSFTNITGLGTLTGLTVQGTANINTTGTASTAIGNGTGTFSLSSSALNISTAGALSGVTGITTSGGYTQSGSTANTFSGATSFTAAGTALSVTNNASIGGVLTVNIITPSGSMTIGSSTQDLTLQGNAVTTITVTDSGNTTTLSFVTPTDNTVLRFPALSAGTYDICTSSGNCQGAGVTLQSAYNNSTDPEIIVDGTRGALTIRDASTPIGNRLLEVQDNAGSVTYFAVTAAGIQTTGSIASSGNINTSTGVIQTGGTTRIDNSGNLVNIGNITGSSAMIIQPAAGQALTITAHATSSWTTDNGNLTIDTTASGGILNLGTGSQNKTVNLGTTNGTSTTTIQAGTGGISIISGANVTIGASDTTGTLLILDVMTGNADDPIGTNGAMYYNDELGRFRCYQNGSWGNCDGGASAAEYLRAEMVTQQTTDLGNGDHIKFDTVDASSGNSITLDTTSAYTNGAGVSIGRFTLKGGKTYRLSAHIPYIVFNSSSGAASWVWYDVTNNAELGSKGTSRPHTQTDSSYDSPNVGAVFSPSTDTLVEFRISAGGSSLQQIGNTGNFNASAFIEVLSDGTKVAQFQGATGSTDGQSGFIPGPVAGQEGSLLVGDGSWSSGLTFLNTGADRGLRLESTEDAIIILNADTDNDGSEVGSPSIKFNQDGGAVTGGIGLIQTAGTDPFGTATTGALANALYLGAGNNNLQFGANGAVGMTITSAGTVGIGSAGNGTAPTGAFDVLQGDSAASNSSFFRRDSGQYLELRTNASGNGLLGFSNSGNSKNLYLASDTNSTGIAFYTGATTSAIGTLRLTIDSATGNILVGQSNTTGTLLVLDAKTGSGDPSNVDGGMYYNAGDGKFRCHENGVWVNCISGPPKIVRFTSSGTFSKASYPGIRGVMVECQGGGGAGGGAAATGAGQASAGAGGRGGSYTKTYFVAAASLAASVTVTVGTGGTGGTGSGGNGGTTSFGSHCSAAGGGGGAVGTAGSSPSAWSGATGTNGGTNIGDLVTHGQHGTNSFRIDNNLAMAGDGGGSALAQGVRGARENSDGISGQNYGGGGSGASNTANQAARSGGDGGPGIVIVTIYY